MIIDKPIVSAEKTINALAKNYNILDYYVNLISSLKRVYPSENFDDYSKYELHKLFNDRLLEKYNGEEILKYKLFKHHIKKRNIVAAFEIKVNNSRVDFLTINGHTTSFEIKTELDTLYKLEKQMTDYMLAFEYNYLVVDRKHLKKAQELLPESYGLWCYENGKYKKQQEAAINNNINPEVQLSLLTKRELQENFPEQNGILKDILISYDSSKINIRFKKILKNRYKDRWEFLISNQANILPIDTQFFFNTNILPNYIYGS
jgi:hypothetical protein